MAPGLLDLPWALWAGFALTVAVLFAFVAPGSSGTTGLRFVVLRWFHPLTWLLLALSALIRGFLVGASGPADLVAQLALVTYVVFLLTFVGARRRHHSRKPVP
jgi:hypothetical protein